MTGEHTNKVFLGLGRMIIKIRTNAQRKWSTRIREDLHLIYNLIH